MFMLPIRSFEDGLVTPWKGLPRNRNLDGRLSDGKAPHRYSRARGRV
jgi:hypothetical protein